MKKAIALGLPLFLATLASSRGAVASPSLDDYRHFRALSLDLAGRIPTRAEVAAFEAPGFDTDAWIASHVKGPAYVDRLRSIYMDLLRLKVGSTFQFVPQPTTLRREQITGPDGAALYVYFRNGQRRTRMETDGVFCLTADETGYQYPHFVAPTPYAVTPPHPVLQADLDANTTLVKPWWLYRDYKSATPTELYSPSWAADYPGFVPTPALLVDADMTTPTTAIRVCKEEAQTADTGTIYASGNVTKPAPGTPPPYGRIDPLPIDNSFATKHKGNPVVCATQAGGNLSADCGCGVGLERCMPAATPGFDPTAFVFTSNQPIGVSEPTDATNEAQSAWSRLWWGEEVSQLMGYVFSEDRDFREILTGHYSLVNGPLVQFYKSVAASTCCGNAINLGYLAPVPLFDPAALPTDLLPHDATKWELVNDRGPNSSGILTTPVFLTKFGSRRARAHVLYTAFECRDFIAGNIQLMPSTEPNLMIREGCSTCHATLEPLAAYFSRIVENDWTFLPTATFPILDPACANVGPDGGVPPSSCANYYDPAFTNTMTGTLRGSYPDTYSNGSYGPPVTHHADEGPAGIATALTSDPGFPGCVAQNVASAFLGRSLTSDDAAFQQTLSQAFVSSNYKLSALVTAVVKSDRYRASNNWTSTEWREAGGK